MPWWWVVFGIPCTALGFEWMVLGSRRRDQLRHITVVVAMLFGTAASFLGIWSLVHIDQLRLRAVSDYGIETFGLLLSIIAILTTLSWVAIERNWLSWLALAVSGWMLVVWGLMASSY